MCKQDAKKRNLLLESECIMNTSWADLQNNFELLESVIKKKFKYITKKETDVIKLAVRVAYMKLVADKGQDEYLFDG